MVCHDNRECQKKWNAYFLDAPRTSVNRDDINALLVFLNYCYRRGLPVFCLSLYSAPPMIKHICIFSFLLMKEFW